MRLVKPSYEIMDKIDGDAILIRLEEAARTCYKSEDKITKGSAIRLMKAVMKRGHESVIEHEKITVRIICDRGISHEIVRHRLASYSQESSRFCNYKGGVEFILPYWVVGHSIGEYSNNSILLKWKKYLSTPSDLWLLSMARAEKEYLGLLKFGWLPEQARSVLPNSLKTEIVVTYNLREWRHFFKLRTAKAAHPQMREITMPLLEEFKQIPILFDDI